MGDNIDRCIRADAGNGWEIENLFGVALP